MRSAIETMLWIGLSALFVLGLIGAITLSAPYANLLGLGDLALLIAGGIYLSQRPR